MLVLSRRENETIRIGEHILIVVTKVAGNRTRIAIHAPQDVKIMRGELRDEPKENAA